MSREISCTAAMLSQVSRDHTCCYSCGSGPLDWYNAKFHKASAAWYHPLLWSQRSRSQSASSDPGNGNMALLNSHHQGEMGWPWWLPLQDTSLIYIYIYNYIYIIHILYIYYTYIYIYYTLYIIILSSPEIYSNLPYITGVWDCLHGGFGPPKASNQSVLIWSAIHPVLQLQIPVHNIVTVQVVDGLEHLPHDIRRGLLTVDLGEKHLETAGIRVADLL